MKHLIFLFLFVPGLLLSQEFFVEPSSEFKMDSRIEPYVESFISDAEDRGFFLRSYLIDKIDYALFDNSVGMQPGDYTLGVVGLDKRGFYLSPAIESDPLVMRITVMHEIGHIIKKSGEHTCSNCYDIMSDSLPLDRSPFTNDVFWNLKVDEYFIWLNDN